MHTETRNHRNKSWTITWSGILSARYNLYCQKSNCYTLIWIIKVFIGGLRKNADKEEIKDAFREFGRVSRKKFVVFFLIHIFFKVLKIWVAQRPPGFGFVLMSDQNDARDAVKNLHGTKICGHRWILLFFATYATLVLQHFTTFPSPFYTASSLATSPTSLS